MADNSVDKESSRPGVDMRIQHFVNFLRCQISFDVRIVQQAFLERRIVFEDLHANLVDHLMSLLTAELGA